MSESKQTRVTRHINDGHYGEPPKRQSAGGYGFMLAGLALMLASVVAYVGLR